MTTGRAAPWLAALTASLAFAFVLRHSTFVPWGTDAAGYIAAAHRWAAAQPIAPSPLQLGPSWARDGTVVAPLAFRPGVRHGTDVSQYPLGYPVMMAAAIRLGGDLAAYAVAPLCAALLVWCTYLIGATVAGPWAGVLASVMVAASPVTFVDAVEPMSDVPAAALWALSWAMSTRPGTGASAAAGAAVALAVMVRPNLAPLALVPAWLQWSERAQVAAGEGWRRLLVFAAAAAIGPALVLWSQSALYGGAFSPSYSGWEAFYRTAHIRQNLTRYPGFLILGHTPLAFAGLATPWLLRVRALNASLQQRRMSDSAAVLAVLTYALYLPYLPFEDPRYLRFMIPAVTALFVLLAAFVVVTAHALARVSRVAAPVALIPALVVSGAGVPFLAYGRTLTETELRVDLMGRYLGEALPANAVVLSFLQSGALAFYTRRPIVRLDLLAPDTLDAAIIELGQRGYHPVIVLDELMEAPAFPARFPGSALRTLDWPPRAIARDAGAALLYFDPADRPDAQRGHQWAVDVIARR